MLSAPNFGGRAPEFLDLHYKAHTDCDHVAKFHGDRPRELGDLVAKEIRKKASLVKHKAFRNYRSERPNNLICEAPYDLNFRGAAWRTGAVQ